MLFARKTMKISIIRTVQEAFTMCSIPLFRPVNLVFDIDDTMYDLMEPFKKAHEKFFAGRVSMDSTELFQKSRVYSDIILAQEKEGKIRREDSFHERLRMTYRDAGLEITREESRRFETEYRFGQTVITMFDFMKDVLDYCKEEGIPIAALTNGNHEGQWRKVEALNLQRWFLPEQIFISGDIGYHKPDVHAFMAVGESMDFLPEHTWYIGDTYESDIVGASRAGWRTLWLNHRKRPCPDAASAADKELTSGDELLMFIRSLL